MSIEDMLGIVRSNPEYLAAKAQVDAMYARAEVKTCIRGNCTLWIDPIDGRAFAAFGAAGCDCDDEPEGS